MFKASELGGKSRFGSMRNRYSRYLYASSSFANAVLIILKMMAEASAPATESENRAFFLVIATGFTAISEAYTHMRISFRTINSIFLRREEKLDDDRYNRRC